MVVAANAPTRAVAAALVEVFAQEGDKLNALDAQLGDGDHGLSMQTGLRAVLKLAEDQPGLAPDAFLRQAGLDFNEAAGSTIGILIMSALKSAGDAIAGKTELGTADLAAMLDAAIGGIMKRGKAKPGQKTILDSLVPALETLKDGADRPAAELSAAAAEAARLGAEGTSDLTSSTGRARWFKERSVGIMDPGAWSGYLIVRTIGVQLTEAGR